jgi:hypothetical protein
VPAHGTSRTRKPALRSDLKPTFESKLDAPCSCPASRFRDVVDPLTEHVGSFQAAHEIVVLVYNSSVPVLQQAARQVRLRSRLILRCAGPRLRNSYRPRAFPPLEWVFSIILLSTLTIAEALPCCRIQRIPDQEARHRICLEAAPQITCRGLFREISYDRGQLKAYSPG